MKIVIAPDSFKGSLSAIGVIEAIKKSAIRVFDNPEIVEIPIADGGEGTVEAALYANDGTLKTVSVQNPLGENIEASYGMIGDTAIFEMATCSGLTLLSESRRDAKKTTTYGTGQMIKHILDKGFKNIIIGIGGSATNDGGTGMALALGAKFFDEKSEEFDYMCGEKLSGISKIDISGMDKRLKDCDIKVMCDVTNPLTGEFGATNVYGKQKGADKNARIELESGMIYYEDLMDNLFSKDIGKTPGAGAAGGLGLGLLAYCGAKLVSGIDAILELADFENKVAHADLIVSGEGRVDNQSAFGKVIHGVTLYANKADVPVMVIAGGVADGAEALYDIGVKSIISIADRPMDLKTCMEQADTLIEKASYNAFSLIKMGQKN